MKKSKRSSSRLNRFDRYPMVPATYPRPGWGAPEEPTKPDRSGETADPQEQEKAAEREPIKALRPSRVGDDD